MSIAVIGAGVIGLSTALSIQKNIPGTNVTVIAEHFSPHTTSDVAAGIFIPSAEKLKGTPPDLVRQIIQDSFNHFDKLLNSSEGGKAGITRLSGYNLYAKPQPKMTYEDIVYCSRPCTQEELSSLPIKYPYGSYVTTLQIESRKYLPWLLDRIQKNGGTILQRRIGGLEELAGRYDVIVNCAGLGNIDLTTDSHMVPVRGQGVRVHAPWIKHFYRGVEGNIIRSVLPCFDTVHLGSNFQMGDWDRKPHLSEREMLLDRCKQLVPSLEGVEIVRDVVGLRPWREPIRMERELITVKSHVQQVVHNYGHNSSGVALSWGAAVHVTPMVKQALKRDPLSAKL